MIDEENDKKIALGIIRTSYGLEGYVKIKSFSGESLHFKRIKEVYLKTPRGFKMLEVEKVKATPELILIKFKGIDSPEKGKSLAGLELWVGKEFGSPLNPGEYYLADLCQCSVYREDLLIGKIRSVFEGGAGEILEVISPAGKTIMIPFTDRFVGDVHIKEKRVEIKREFDIS